MEKRLPLHALMGRDQNSIDDAIFEPKYDSGASSNDESLDRSPRKGRLRHLTSKTKARTKRLFDVGSTEPQLAQTNDEQYRALKYVQEDLAFNPSRLAKRKSVKVEGTADKITGALQSITTTVLHPKKFVIDKAKRTTAGNLSSSQRPHLSQQADYEFLEAHDNLSRAQSTQSSRHNTSDNNESEDEETNDCRNKVAILEAQRESLAVAWTTSHIDRVRVVPKEHFTFPHVEAFIERDDAGSEVRYKWEKWLGNVCMYKPSAMNRTLILNLL